MRVKDLRRKNRNSGIGAYPSWDRTSADHDRGAGSHTNRPTKGKENVTGPGKIHIPAVLVSYSCCNK